MRQKSISRYTEMYKSRAALAMVCPAHFSHSWLENDGSVDIFIQGKEPFRELKYLGSRNMLLD